MTYNTRSPAVKRLMKEAQELSEATELYYARPLEDNLFEWHFTIRGPGETDYGGGIYHGRIILPPEYPMKPPNILLMTPSGRFEINRKICLSISGYHPETWRPSWSIRTALLAIVGFMPSHGVGAIGSLDYPPEERRKLARASVDFVCPQCGPVRSALKSVTEASQDVVAEARDLAQQISFTGEKSTVTTLGGGGEADTVAAPAAVVPELTPSVSPLPQVPSQPLSFVEWRLEKMKHQASQEGDNKPVVTPIVTVDSSLDASGSTEETVVTQRRISEASVSGLVNESPEPAPIPTPTPPVIATEPAVRSPTITTEVLRHRQGYLLKAIILVASMLGLLLASRLHTINREIDN